MRWYLRFRLSAADVRGLLAERGVDVSARTVLRWVRQFAPQLARAGRRAAVRSGTRWWCDETDVRVGGQWAYLYLRPGNLPSSVDTGRGITDKHPAYACAVREEVPRATHTPSGLHRAIGPDTKPIERSHVPTKDRLRPMRGLQSIRTG